MMRSGRSVALLLLSAGLLAGCASARGHAPMAQSRSRLSRAELAATNASNLYDAIAKLRPEWLTSRGPTSVTNTSPTLADVYMNGTMLGGIDYLRQVSVLEVSEVRFWEAGAASARFGLGHPRGVIELIR
jgi:hypothetical protein